MRSIATTLYLVVGAVIAAGHHYFARIDAVRPLVSAVLAVALWPLILIGIDLRIH